MMNKKRVIGFLLFPLCTTAGLMVAARITHQSFAALWTLPLLNSSTWIELTTLSLLVYVTDIWRFQICGRALGIRLSWLTCLEASVVSLFFAWITPGGALGAASAGFILKKRANVGWDDALLLAFGKSLTGIAFLVGMAAISIVLGIGPDMNRRVIFYPLLFGLASYGLLIGLILLGALFPEPVLAKLAILREKNIFGLPLSASVGFVGKMVQRLRSFLKNGRRISLLLIVSHLLYFLAFILIATVVVYELGGRPFINAFGVSVVKTAAVYVAPTPGGAGISEMTAEAFYGGLLPPALAVSAVLIFRVFTFYTQILTGLLYFLVLGGFAQVLKFADNRGKSIT